MCFRILFLQVLMIGAFPGCGRVEVSDSSTVGYSEDVEEYFELQRTLLPYHSSVEISHLFPISNNSSQVMNFVLESKSCGCLSYLPKQFAIQPNSNASVLIKGHLTGSRSQSYFDYFATYRNSGTRRLIRCRLGVWVAPAIEVLENRDFDGRVLWARPGKVESSVSVVFRSDGKRSLDSCLGEVLIGRESEDILSNFDLSSISVNEQSGFLQRSGLLRFPVGESGVTDNRDADLTLRLSMDELVDSRSLIVKTRAGSRCVPTGLFFRNGVAGQKFVVVESDKPVTIEGCHGICAGLDVEWVCLTENLHRVTVSYDGSDFESETVSVRLGITRARDDDVDKDLEIPAHFIKSSTNSMQK